MKYLPLLLLFFTLPAKSITWNQFWRPFENGAYYRSPVYYVPMCNRIVYREEYISGTEWGPGYVRYWREKIRVPCNSY